MSGSTPLCDRLLAGRPESPPPAERAALEEELAGIVERARAAWPDVGLPPETFVAHLAERLPENAPLREALSRLCLEDLYLAAACVRGLPRAAAAFESRYGAEIRRNVDHARLPGIAADEVAQAVQAQVLVGDGTNPPRISQYAGRGDLSGWLRVVAVREGLMRLRGRRREVPLDDGQLAQLVDDDSDPELAYLRGTYRAEFKAAFAEALSGLDAQERNLLRYHYLDRLGLEALATMNRVHRATVVRWLARARERVVAGTVTALRRRIKVSDSEFHSLVLVLRSRIDLSVRRLMEDQ